jgi:hypothetical protein
MSVSLTDSIGTLRRPRALAPLCVAAGAYLLLLFLGDGLLQDSDSFWQIKVGQWIMDHHAVPTSDTYSFTRVGQPWTSNAWLSQVLYALSYAQWGWAGPVALASLAVAASLALLTSFSARHVEPAHAILLAMLALMLSWPHLLARPHVLALPVMVGFVGAMIAAADRRAAPSPALLPLMALWANLHGGFVLGLALVAPVGLIAVAEAPSERRFRLALRWALFGLGALGASCCTPYGIETLAAAARIIDLGAVLSVISEWKPADFGHFGLFEACLLALTAWALYRGVVLSWPRVLLLLVLAHMALSHVRSIDALAFLAPLLLARPLAGDDAPAAHHGLSPPSAMSLIAAIALAAGCLATTLSYRAHHDFVFAPAQTPAAAVELLKARQARRIFNAYEFGGYLIDRDLPTFIDGRAELYGETFAMDYFNAVAAREPDTLYRLLDAFEVDATLLTPASPAAKLLDRTAGWKRLYADGTAIVHVRDRAAEASR